MKLKIAFLQLVPDVNIEDNIEKGIKACREAKANGADIVLFPEMWSSGYVFPHNKEWLEQNALSLDSEYVKRFSETALELDMAIAVTLLEKHELKPRNTVCLFDRHGKLVYHYSKVHICDFGEDDDEGVLDAGDDFYVDMPDLMENIDVLASLRGAQDILFDLLDEPEMIGERIQEVTDIYYEYYDRFYDIIKDEEGGNAYTVFQIWGPGRTVKLQCDFSAMMSPEDFRKYIQPSLRTQSENVDHVLYHLDGPAAIKHMDALMEIDGIDALQWTSVA